jgi:uncharacterized protein YndB with AHSA1/START domain
MDELVRELFLPVGMEEAWRALTDPAEMERWFGDHVQVDLRPGGRLAVGWDDTGSFSGVVEVVEAPRRLVYRWCIAWDQPVDVGPTTRVEMSLTPTAGGVVLRVCESGFAALPPRLLDGNRGGWEQELGHLATLLTTPP